MYNIVILREKVIVICMILLHLREHYQSFKYYPVHTAIGTHNWETINNFEPKYIC